MWAFAGQKASDLSAIIKGTHLGFIVLVFDSILMLYIA